MYVGSADWMGRNLDRRVEIVLPVLDPLLAETIYGQILAVLFADNVKARELQSDGTYRRLNASGQMPINAQQVFLTQSQAL